MQISQVVVASIVEQIEVTGVLLQTRAPDQVQPLRIHVVLDVYLLQA